MRMLVVVEEEAIIEEVVVVTTTIKFNRVKIGLGPEPNFRANIVSERASECECVCVCAVG